MTFSDTKHKTQNTLDMSRTHTFSTVAPVVSLRGWHFRIGWFADFLVTLLSITTSRDHFILLLTFCKVLHSTIHYNSAHATFKIGRENNHKSNNPFPQSPFQYHNIKMASSSKVIKCGTNIQLPYKHIPWKLVEFLRCHCACACLATSGGTPPRKRGVSTSRTSWSPAFTMDRATPPSTRRVKFWRSDSNSTVCSDSSLTNS